MMTRFGCLGGEVFSVLDSASAWRSVGSVEWDWRIKSLLVLACDIQTKSRTEAS